MSPLLSDLNHIGGVMVSVLAPSAVDRGFETRLGQTKDYKICICCFSNKHAVLRRKSKDWLARNWDNVSEQSNMSTNGLLFQWPSTIKNQLSVLVKYKRTSSLFHWIKLVLSWYSWKIAELALNNNHSFYCLNLILDIYLHNSSFVRGMSLFGLVFLFSLYEILGRFNFSVSFQP